MPAATRRMLRPRKLLETEVPSAAFFLSAAALEVAAASEEPAAVPVTATPAATLLATLADELVAVEFEAWKRI